MTNTAAAETPSAAEPDNSKRQESEEHMDGMGGWWMGAGSLVFIV